MMAHEPRDPSRTLNIIRAALPYLDPSFGYPDWFRIGAAVHGATHGSQDGLALFDLWSSGSKSRYPGCPGIERQWKYYSNNRGRPITMGTLRWYVEREGIEWSTILRDAGADD